MILNRKFSGSWFPPGRRPYGPEARFTVQGYVIKTEPLNLSSHLQPMKYQFHFCPAMDFQVRILAIFRGIYSGGDKPRPYMPRSTVFVGAGFIPARNVSLLTAKHFPGSRILNYRQKDRETLVKAKKVAQKLLLIKEGFSNRSIAVLLLLS